MGQWANSRPGKIHRCCVMAFKIQNCLNVHLTNQSTGCMVVIVQCNANRLLSVSSPISKNKADSYMSCKAMAHSTKFPFALQQFFGRELVKISLIFTATSCSHTIMVPYNTISSNDTR